MTSKDYVRLDRTLERYKNYINEEHNFQKDKFIKEDASAKAQVVSRKGGEADLQDSEGERYIYAKG
jgi:hypothetical protein